MTKTNEIVTIKSKEIQEPDLEDIKVIIKQMFLNIMMMIIETIRE